MVVKQNRRIQIRYCDWFVKRESPEYIFPLLGVCSSFLPFLTSTRERCLINHIDFEEKIIENLQLVKI